MDAISPRARKAIAAAAKHLARGAPRNRYRWLRGLWARGDMAFGVPYWRPPTLAWPLRKLPRWCGRAGPRLVPRLYGLAAISDPIILFPPDQIWSHRGIVKLHYLRRLHP